MDVSEKDLRVNVDSVFLERLRSIREYYGVKSNAEMVRILVSEKFHEIEERIRKGKS